VTFVSHIVITAAYYTVSQKNIPDIFDCNLKINYQILYKYSWYTETQCININVIDFTNPWVKPNLIHMTWSVIGR